MALDGFFSVDAGKMLPVATPPFDSGGPAGKQDNAWSKGRRSMDYCDERLKHDTRAFPEPSVEAASANFVPSADEGGICGLIFVWAAVVVLPASSISVNGLLLDDQGENPSDEDATDETDERDNPAPVNQPPIFKTPPVASILENTPADQPVYQAIAVDPEDAVVLLRLSEQHDVDNQYFSLTDAGLLRFLSSPDYELPQGGGQVPNDYWVRIVATDGLQESALDVLVSVQDVNEPPSFTSSDNAGRFTNISARTIVYQALAIDPEQQPIRYHLAEGSDDNDNHLFTMNQSGHVRYKPEFYADYLGDNRPRQDSYRLTITASDDVNDVIQDVLLTLRTNSGAMIDGELTGGFTGSSVSRAGDFNGDGYDDIIVGAPFADFPSGGSHIIFGGPNGLAPTVEVMSLTPSQGMSVFRGTRSQELGHAVSFAGDFDSDGHSDVIVGSPSTNNGRGAVYLIFGTAIAETDSVSSFQESMVGDGVFSIFSSDLHRMVGNAVDTAGDFNGDGFTDLLVSGFDLKINSLATAYVIFGQREANATGIDLDDPKSTAFFAFDSFKPKAKPGKILSAAGDINADGIDDIIVGSSLADTANGRGAGQSHVIFGAKQDLADRLSPSLLNGENGFSVLGGQPHANLGHSVSSAGDINADGIADILMGAPGQRNSEGSSAGATYVLFGQCDGFSSTIDSTSFNGLNGFAIVNDTQSFWLGWSVAAAGDMNGDHVDDLVVSAPMGTDVGRVFVIFGQTDGFDPVLSTSSLTGTNGFVIQGSTSLDYFGFSVSSAGDVNSDGMDDIIIGAPASSQMDGASYVIYGRQNFPALFDVTDLMA